MFETDEVASIVKVLFEKHGFDVLKKSHNFSALLHDYLNGYKKELHILRDVYGNLGIGQKLYEKHTASATEREAIVRQLHQMLQDYGKSVEAARFALLSVTIALGWFSSVAPTAKSRESEKITSPTQRASTSHEKPAASRQSKKNVIVTDRLVMGLKSDGTIEVDFPGGRPIGWQNGHLAHGGARPYDFSEWYDIVEIVSACRTVVGLKSDGTVVAVKENYLLKTIDGWKNIERIIGSDYYLVGIRRDGSVVVDVHNNNFMVNTTTWRDIVSVHVNSWDLIGLKSDGTVVATSSTAQKSNYAILSRWRNVNRVTVDYGMIAGLRADGTVTVASGNHGNFLISDWCNSWQDISYIYSGHGRLVGLKNNGTLVVAGNNRNGAYAIARWQNIVDVVMGRSFTAGLKSDGSVVVATTSAVIKGTDWQQWRNIVALYAGSYHMVGLTKDSTIVSCMFDMISHSDGQRNYYDSDGTYYGQSDVENWPKVKNVIVQDNSTIGITASGAVFVTGHKFSSSHNKLYGNMQEEPNLARFDVSNWRDIKTQN